MGWIKEKIEQYIYTYNVEKSIFYIMSLFWLIMEQIPFFAKKMKFAPRL